MIRKLIEYGMELAGTLKQGTAAPNFMLITFNFSTANVAEMLARIARALHLAAALEGKLLGYVEPPERELPKARLPAYCRAPPTPRAKPEAEAGVLLAQTAQGMVPGAAAADGSGVPSVLGEDAAALARMLTADEIADPLRRRPIGAIVADICFDLGIQPGHELWRELYLVILDNGGNPHGLFVRNMKRETIFFRQSLAELGISGQTRWRLPPPEGCTPPPAEARGTGPP